MRLFVGIELPAAMRQSLTLIATGLAGARWVPAQNYHLTLRFIGEVPTPVARDIDDALCGLRGRRLSLALSGVGCFEKTARPVALWAGVERNPALDHLQNKIETAMRRAGLPPLGKRFTPHVTLARFETIDGAKLAQWVQTHNLLRTNPAEIAHITLFSSRLGKENSVYTAEAEYELQG